MEFQETETYFYQQTTYRKTAKRYKKLPDELPNDLKYAHLNPRIAALYANKDKEKNDELLDGLGGKSLLPQINQTVSLIRQRLDSLLSTESEGQRALYESTKHASFDILTQLSHVLYLFEGLHVPLPKSLEHALLQGWKELRMNAGASYREWQLPSSRDAWENSRRAQEPSLMSERSSSRPGSVAGRGSAMDNSPRDGDDDKGKDSEGIKRARSKLASRTGNLEGIAEDEEAEPGKRGRLPEGGGLASLSVPRRRESQTSMSRSKTRINQSRPNSGRTSVRRRDDGSVMESVISDANRSMLGTTRDYGYYAVIQFQLSSKACDDKGWIIHPDSDEMDGDRVYEWAIQRLQVVLKNKHEQDEEDAAAGRDTPFVLRLYGDKRKEELQKYKRTGSGRSDGAKSARKGKKPTVPPMEPQLDPAKPILMSTVSDGTSSVYYPTGRPAIVSSRSQTGKPGFYTLVYDNNVEQRMLACFTPSGRACCYNPNGSIRFIATSSGGTTADENGGITKRWEWPTGGVQAKLPIPVVVPLNNHISFRCQSLHQMQLFFQCHKEQAKFNVGIAAGAEEPPSREELGKLLTGYIFTSHASKDYAKAYKRQSKKNKGKSKLFGVKNPWGLQTGYLNDASPLNPFRGERGGGGMRGMVRRSHSALGIRRALSSPGSSSGGSPGLAGGSAPSSLLLAAMRNSARHAAGDDSEDTDPEGTVTPKVRFSVHDSPFAKVFAKLPPGDDAQEPASGSSAGKPEGGGDTRFMSPLKLDTSRRLSRDEKPDEKPMCAISTSDMAASQSSPSSSRRNSKTEATASPGPSRAGSPQSRSRPGSPVHDPPSATPPPGTPPTPGTPLWPRPRSSKKPPTDSVADLQKSLEIQEVTENDAEADTILVKLQRKARNLVEDWQEHYRVAMGIQSPDLRLVRDRPRKERYINSAKSSPGGGGIVIIEPSATQIARADVGGRVPSAPVDHLLKLSDELYRMSLSALNYMGPVPEEGRVTEAPSPAASPVPPGDPAEPAPAPAVKFDENPPEEYEAAEVTSQTPSTPFPASLFSRSTGSPGPRSSRTKSAPQRLAPTPSIPEQFTPSVGLCPLALRQSLLGEERGTCRCSRHKIPYITDIEYDEFIDNQAPDKQMVIVSVLSSLYPEATPAQSMLEGLYAEKNRNRTRPCVQGRQDPFRLLFYDVASAAELSDHTQPLLLRRHNVVPGMFLMYEGGRLIFCDHIFNGYGNARKDFHKQIVQTRRTADQGYAIPKDFRFSPAKGRHGPRSAWGGEIGGAGVGRHASTGVSLEQQAVKRSSLTSLSSDGSDYVSSRQLRLSGLIPTASRCIKMLSAPIHQVMMAERGQANALRASDPGASGATITVLPPSPRTERSLTLPAVSKANRMHTLQVS